MNQKKYLKIVWTPNPERRKALEKSVQELAPYLDKADRMASGAMAEAWALFEENELEILSIDSIESSVQKSLDKSKEDISLLRPWSVWSKAETAIRQAYIEYIDSLGIKGKILESWSFDGVKELSPARSGSSSIFPTKVFIDTEDYIEFIKSASEYNAVLKGKTSQLKVLLVLMSEEQAIKQYPLKRGEKAVISRSVARKADRVLVLKVDEESK